MNESLLILGRQPALGIAELEALYGADNVMRVGEHGAQVHLASEQIDFRRLGGSVKLCKVLNVLETTKWDEIEKYLIKTTPAKATLLSSGKLTIGLSAYGLKVTPARLRATGLTIKKSIRSLSDRSVRLVPNNEPALSSAQTYHNRLTSEKAWELVLLVDGSKTILAQVTAVQDIDSYTNRDRGRPKRDARVGMLPPKLAQIIINLAKVTPNGVILDPFCGTGVLLQEALLMGYGVYGSDNEPRMIEYSRANLDWLLSGYPLKDAHIVLKEADATTFKNQDVINGVASETYLGRPFTETPQPEILNKTISECNTILKKFLQNLHGQIGPNTPVSLAVPAWQIGPNRFKHLPLIDQISELGYNQVRFEHAKTTDLLYYREGQFTARELLVLTRK